MNNFVLEFAETTVKVESKWKVNIVANYKHAMTSTFMIAGDLKKLFV